MAEKPTLLTVYRYLPQTNCGECGEATCMAFASKLLERAAKVEDCPPLVKDPKLKGRREKLADLVAPPVREVIVGSEKNAVKIGGKEVLYRHELTFHNPTALAMDLSDKLEDQAVLERCKSIEAFKIEKMGQKLGLDLIAIRCASGDPGRFAKVASLVTANTRLPLMLCSLDPEAVRSAMEASKDNRPLLYAATAENWRDMGALAKRFNCPLVASAPGDLSLLKSLALTLRQMGVQDLVLDPGTGTEGKALMETISNLTMIRRAGVKLRDKAVGFPLMAVPAVAYLNGQNPVTAAFKEAYLASMFINRYADLLVLHSLETWSLMPILNLRFNVYTDPRKPVAVQAELKTIGEPDENSPVLVTTNFALTAYTVSGDLEASKVSCYLLIADSEGLAVDTAVAGGQLTAAKIKEVLAASGVEGKVKHRRLILPGRAARLRGDVEDATGWEVIVGPKDSSQIADFLKKNWSVPTASDAAA
ncbi:MAG: acetyl-CoA decarbonylase/synthase complex subunit gamma [Candidatus Bathyarchaeia archaeon]